MIKKKTSKCNLNYWKKAIILFVFSILFLVPNALKAHEIRPALLTITETEPGWFDVMWKVPVFEGTVLELKPEFPDGFTLTSSPSNNQVPGAVIQYFTVKYAGDEMAGKEILLNGLGSLKLMSWFN